MTGAFVQVYYLLSPPTGSGLIEVALNGPGNQVQGNVLGALYATGVRGWEGSATAQNGNTQSLTAGPLAVSEGALIVDIAGHSQAPFQVGSGIIGGGDTAIYLRPNGSTGSGSGASYLANATSGDYSATWTIAAAAQREAVLIASFAPSSGADIKSFTANDPFVSGRPVIDHTALTITIPVLPGADLANFAPTFLLSDGATCDKLSGSVQNFNNLVAFSVTSADTLVNRVYTVAAAYPSGLGIWDEPADETWETASNWLNDTLPISMAFFPDLNPPGGAISVNAENILNGNPSTLETLIFDSTESYTLLNGFIYANKDTTVRALRGEHVANVRFEVEESCYIVLDVAQNAKLTYPGQIYCYGWNGENERTTVNGSKLIGYRKTGAGTAVATYDFETHAPWRQPNRSNEVDGGVLLVNNAAGSGLGTYGQIIVNSSGTLGGTGAVGGGNHPATTTGGRPTVNSGGAISPGDPSVNNGVDTFTLKNGLTLNDGSKLIFELGATSDLLRIPGGSFTGSPSAGGVTVSLVDAGDTAGENTYDLIDFEGATPSGVDLSDFQLAPGPYTGGTFTLTDKRLQVTVNPRPFEITNVVRNPVSGAVTLTFPSALGAT